MRPARRTLEDDLFSQIAGFTELFVVYDNSWNANFKRKILFGSDNCEVGYVCMPQSRTRCEVKSREDIFNGSGETSSHFRSLSGVAMAPRMTLPRISQEDKAKIFPDTPQVLPKKWSDAVTAGQPLYWQETKSQEFWGHVLEMINAKCVVDVSPGSGSLALACMEKGLHYFGICRDPVHTGWLSNVLDQAAMKFLSESGSNMYQADLATHIKELFSDMTTGLDDEITDEVIALTDDEQE